VSGHIERMMLHERGKTTTKQPVSYENRYIALKTKTLTQFIYITFTINVFRQISKCLTLIYFRINISIIILVAEPF
jgi:hypothetical protein